MKKKSSDCLKKNQTNNSRAFVILCNNSKFFYRFCKWFPKTGFDDYDFYVVFDNRVKDISDELQNIIDNTENNLIKKFNVINGDIIIEHYKDTLRYAYKDKFCLNNLKDTYFLEKYDYVYGQDDDIVVVRYGKIWTTTKITFHHPGNLSEKLLYKELIEQFIPKFEKSTPIVDQSKVQVIHAGQYFLNKTIYDRYMKFLKLLFNNEKLVDSFLAETRMAAINGWTLDMLIITAALNYYGFMKYDVSKFPSILGNVYIKNHDPRITKQTVLFHYAAPKKEEAFALLENNVLKKLFKPNTINIDDSNLYAVDRKYYG